MESQEPSGYEHGPQGRNHSTFLCVPLPPSGREKRLDQEDIDIGVIRSGSSTYS